MTFPLTLTVSRRGKVLVGVRLRHGGPQDVKPKAEVAANILVAIEVRRI